MMALLVPFLTFMLDHADLINAIWEAVDGGASKSDILAGIKAAQVAAADAAVKADLGRP